MEMTHRRLQMVTLVGILTALQVILGSLLSIQFLTTKIVFTFLVTALAARLVGPWPTALSAALASLLGMLLFPKFAFFPGFVLTAFLVGATYGFLLRERTTAWRIILANGIVMFGWNLFLNSVWLHLMYRISYPTLFATRVPQEIIMFLVSDALVLLLFRLPATKRLIERFRVIN